MSKKKKQTSSKKPLKIPLNEPISWDITLCTANCKVHCARRKKPRWASCSYADLSEECSDFKEKTHAHTSTVSTRRP